MKPSRSKWGAFPAVVIAADESAVKRHSCYSAAKAGDSAAAGRLVRECMTADAVSSIRKIASCMMPTLVSAHAVEESGRNAIPQALATLLGHLLKWPVDQGLVQTNVVNHTGADGFARLARPALFDGAVKPDSHYFLVDDFVGQGGTLANLRGYESKGGMVIGAMALTGKPFSATLTLSEAQLAALRSKHGQLEAWWKERFGYGFECLSQSEARYLERSPDAHTVRDRIVAAAQSDGNGRGASPAGSDESELVVRRTAPEELKPP